MLRVRKRASKSIKHIPLSPGRPRLDLDEELLSELASLGWGSKRIAAEYLRRTGQYVSHETIRGRLTRSGAATCDMGRGDER